MNFHHPITKEKAVLKKMAAIIHDLKEEIVDCGIPTIPGYCAMNYLAAKEMGILQTKLARYKRAYRHRHIAYCQVRRDMSHVTGNKGPIESRHCRRPYNQKLVDFLRSNLLGEINTAYSEYINKLLATVEELKPCIAVFVSKQGREMKLDINDFDRKANGNFVWVSKEDGLVYNNINSWPVNHGDTVSILEGEYEKLPPELQVPDKPYIPQYKI